MNDFHLLIADFKCSIFTLGNSGFTRFQNKQENREKSIFYWYLCLPQFNSNKLEQINLIKYNI